MNDPRTPAVTSAPGFQDLLDQILAEGRQIHAKAQTGVYRDKAAAMASRAEDYLADTMNVPTDTASREAFRKKARIGAGLGALALLLSGRARKGAVAIGGLAGIGALAYSAYKRSGGELPQNVQDAIGKLTGQNAETRARHLLTAMVAAARVDGTISPAELDTIAADFPEAGDMIAELMEQDTSPEEIAALATTEQAGREIYAVSARVADGLNPAERDYLDRLAMALRLDPSLAALLETEVRTGT